MTKHAMIFILPIFFLLCVIHCHFTVVIAVLRRLRWLFLSLFILNLWFNSPELRWLPTSTDLIFAIERVGALVIIVLAAHLLMQVTSTQEMMSALQWWLDPLKKIGFPSEQLALRITLVLDTVDKVQGFYAHATVHPELCQTVQNSVKLQFKWHSIIPSMIGSIQKISTLVAMLFVQVFYYAENTPLRTLEIPELIAPPLWQWSYPLLLLILIIAT